MVQSAAALCRKASQQAAPALVLAPVQVTRRAAGSGLYRPYRLQAKGQPLLRPQANDSAGQSASGGVQLVAAAAGIAAAEEGLAPARQIDSRLQRRDRC